MKPEDLFLQYEKELAEFKLKLIRKLSDEGHKQEEETSKRTSKISLAENVLTEAGKPLHVNDIIAAVKDKFGVELERDSLSSALTKYDRKEKRFQRVAPNTFGLRQT